MLEAARHAVKFAENKDRTDLDTDLMLSSAIVRLLEVVGEAAKNVSKASRKNLPQIPWEQIVATRNRLIHGYFAVDFDVVWTIITKDLPALIVELEQTAPPDDLQAIKPKE
jgi:uncharacterized protein with HEPN domain